MVHLRFAVLGLLAAALCLAPTAAVRAADPPEAPTGLTATPGNNQVILTWNVSPGAEGYQVERALAPFGSYNLIASVTDPAYTDMAVVNGTTYNYRVRAVNATGTSGYSNIASATPVAIPDDPTELTAIAGDGQVALSWNASARADSYEIERAIAPNGPYEAIAVVNDTNYLDTTVVNGTTYNYRVRAVNDYGESGYSNIASATPVAVPAAPTGLTATPGDQEVTLAWTASAGAASYVVRRATTSGGPYSVVAFGVTAATYADAGLTNGVTYYYVVSAVNAAGESPASNEASATPGTPPAAPSGLIAMGLPRRVLLRWTPSTSPGVTQNRVYRATTSGGPYTLRATLGATNTFMDTAVTAGVTYFYVVTAVDAGGRESAASNQVSAQPR